MGGIRNSSGLGILAAAAALLPAAAGAQDCTGDDGRIDWAVEGRFALFEGRDARQAGDRLLDSIKDSGGNLVDGSPAGESGRPDSYQEIVAALTRDGAGALFRHTYYNRDEQRYSREAAFLNPPSYTVIADFVGETDSDCVWTVAGRPTPGKCADQALIIERDWARAPAATAVGVRSASGRSAHACILVEEKLILGLGDSYASGEGNPDRPTRWERVKGLSRAERRPMRAKRSQLLWWPSKKGPLATVPKEDDADAQWWDYVCHRSLLSQQALAAMAYAARNPRRVTTFLSFACSGATIVDGLVGPRVETPGMGWLTPERRGDSPALTESQIKQAVKALCRGDPKTGSPLKLPPEAQAWTEVKSDHAGGKAGEFETPKCKDWRRRPDILLLTIGGNDVGFGGVGWWAIVPPNGRIPLRADVVTWINTKEDRDSAKRDFGVVCPRTYIDERRCRMSKYSAQDLAGQLPALQRLADEALAEAGLDAPVRIKTGYPPVTRDELEALCGRSWGWGDSYQLEPWSSAYSLVLNRARLFNLELAAPFKDWSWGISNKETEDSRCPRLSNPAQQIFEICEIDNFVLDSLNQAVLAPRPGWVNMDQDRLPRTHGICASDFVPNKLEDEQPLAAFRKEWGFPRWSGGHWNDAFPIPSDWEPYARRQRWVRTANDSILTQAVFRGGSAAPGEEREKLRLSESNSGSLHATAQMHAAYAELLVQKIEEVEHHREGRARGR